ncbi:CNNM domain-containing protein, partial [Enterococcus faecalis]|uniref:CNNM domain-containing protein n=1 Tax=Enterococcus faecalis TaxID=1351 RepID=UPI003D6A6BC8
EIAVVSVNKNRVEQKAEDGHGKAQKLLKVLQDPNNFLSTIQVGITLLNILSGASLAETLSSRLAPVLGGGAPAKTLASIIILAL